MNQLVVPLSSRRRLVIVEDEAILALDIERYLTTAGFEVCGVAADGEAALALVERVRPDLVLMDIRLQGDRDGIDTAAAIGERFDVPVVYLTAHSDPKTMERAQATEPMGYLLKPFKKPDLLNVVSIGLARSDDERKLRRREQFLSTTLSCIGEAIVSADRDGKVTYLNLAAEELVGSSSELALDRPLAAVVPLRRRDGSPLNPVALGSLETDGRRMSIEGTIQQPGAPPRSVVATVAELRQGANQFGVVVALRDLTELLSARQQLEFSERLASLGTLAAGVAHEVNNPLSVVMSSLAYLLEAKDLRPGELTEVLREAQDAASRVALIVRDLQTFSSPQVGLLVPLDVREAIGPALQLTRSHWRAVAGIVLDLQPTPTVMALGRRLTQVLVALIINSIQAMKSQQAAHLLRLSSSTDGEGRAVLTISDDGPGIDEALRSRIFDPFFTTKAPGQGTGLGLAVARTIVKNHGGELSVGDGPGGVGVSFSLVLPPTTTKQPPAEPLRAAWVGEACAESRALCPKSHLREDDAIALRDAALSCEVILLAMPLAQASAFCSRHPELEARVLLVSEEEPPPGVQVLRRPFDAQGLTALVRRKA